MRLDVRRVEGLKDSSGSFIGNRTRAKVVKNKVAPPFKEAVFDIMFGEGISKSGEVLDLAVQLEIVQKSGAWFNYGETRLGQGRDNAKQYLADHPEVMAEIEQKVRDNAEKLYAGKRGGKKAAPTASAAAADVQPIPAAATPVETEEENDAPVREDIDIMVEDE